MLNHVKLFFSLMMISVICFIFSCSKDSHNSSNANIYRENSSLIAFNEQGLADANLTKSLQINWESNSTFTINTNDIKNWHHAYIELCIPDNKCLRNFSEGNLFHEALAYCSQIDNNRLIIALLYPGEHPKNISGTGSLCTISLKSGQYRSTSTLYQDKTDKVIQEITAIDDTSDSILNWSIVFRADNNLNQIIDFADFGGIGANYNSQWYDSALKTPIPGGEKYEVYDASKNGKVDFADFGVVGAGYNHAIAGWKFWCSKVSPVDTSVTSSDSKLIKDTNITMSGVTSRGFRIASMAPKKITGYITADTNYIFVAPFDSKGIVRIDLGEEVKVINTKLILDAPINVKATDGAYADRITITWDKVIGATGYKIFKDDSKASPMVVVGDVNTWDDKTYDTSKHTYWVIATDGLRDSALSLSDEGTFNTTTKLSAPTNVKASKDLYLDKIIVTWDKVSGATGYTILDGSVPLILSDVDNWNNTTVDALEHNYTVTARDATTESAPSAPAIGSFKVAPATDLVVTKGLFRDKIVISWKKSPSATGYDLYRDDIYTTIPFGSYGDTALINDVSVFDYKTHTYWIRATRKGADTSKECGPDTGYINKWVVMKVDDAVGAGGTNSIADFSSGNAGIAYYNMLNYDLKYAYSIKSTPTSMADWKCITVDDVGKVGEYASLAMMKDGTAGISYFDATNLKYKFAKANTKTPTGDTKEWSYMNIAPSDTGWCYSSMVVLQPSGKPVIAYYDTTGGKNTLKLAIATKPDPETSGDWTLSTIDDAPVVGTYCKLFLWNDAPAVAYVDFGEAGSNMFLKFAWASVQEPTKPADWTFVIVDNTKEACGRPSTALLNNKPIISYTNYSSSGYLKFARDLSDPPDQMKYWGRSEITPTDCSGASAITTVNSSTVRVPAVVFAGAKPNSLLTYAVALTNTPSSPTDWDVSIIDSVNHGNFDVSIAQTDKDQPIVSYTPYAYGITSLWYARCEPLY